MVFVPFSQHAMADADSALGALIVLNFLGNNFHVAASSWFFTDKEMRAHFRQHPRRYIIVPLLLIVGCALLFQFADKPLRSWTLAAFFSWQLWHFQKQNVGVLSFIAAGTGSGPLSVWERRTLAAAAVAGILGFFSLAKIGLSDWAPQLAAGPPAGRSRLSRGPGAVRDRGDQDAGARRLQAAARFPDAGRVVLPADLPVRRPDVGNHGLRPRPWPPVCRVHGHRERAPEGTDRVPGDAARPIGPGRCAAERGRHGADIADLPYGLRRSTASSSAS